MNRIIRLNAPHISSQSDVSKKCCDRAPSETDVVSRMALIHGKSIAFVEAGVTLEAPKKTHTTIVESSKTASKSTENEEGSYARAEGRRYCIEEDSDPRTKATKQKFSKGLKPLFPLVIDKEQDLIFPSAPCLLPSAVVDKTPKAFSLLSTIRSIAFFTAVVVWSWTGRIEQASQVRGKVVALEEQSQTLPHHLDTINNTVVTSAREWKPIEIVAELNGEFSPAEVEDQQQQLATNQMSSSQVHSLINSSRLLAHTRTAIKVLETLADRASQTSAVNNKPTDVIDLRRNAPSVSNKVVSTASSAESTKKLGQVYRS